MPGEIRVDVHKSNSGLGTVSLNSFGQVIVGITTIENLYGGNTMVLPNPFIEMNQTISYDYTIGDNRNALTAGPVTIESGVNVTIPSGSNWTIV